MRDRLVEQMEEKQGVTEKLKAENQMMWDEWFCHYTRDPVR